MSERYVKLFALPKNLYTCGSPVVIVAGALLKDNQTGKVLAQLKLQNIGVKSIKAVKVSVRPLDTVGNAIGTAIEYQYLDLNAYRDGEFGAKSPIFLTDTATRSFTASATQVIFSDNTVWQAYTDSWESLSAPVMLESALKDSELVKQYRIQYGTDCKYNPAAQKDLWYCACGALNRKEESVCHHCQKSVSTLMSVDLDVLSNNRDIRVAAEQQKAAEEKAAADIKAKKTKKLAMIIISIAVVLIVAAVLVSNIVKKNQEEAARLEAYNAAIAMVEAGKYDDAIAAFTDLGEYKDSAKQIEIAKTAKMEAINAPIYENAMAYISAKEYVDAYALLQALGDYRDAADYLDKFHLLKTQLHYDSYSLGTYGSKWNYEYFIDYSYDEHGNLICEDKVVPERPDAVAPNTWEYEYDESGIKIRGTLTNYSDSDKRQVTSSTSYEYDPNGITIGWTSVKYTDGVAEHSASNYENIFSDSGCVTYQKTIQSDMIWEYTYDTNGHLLCEKFSDGYNTRDRRYTYDQDGNLVSSILTQQDGITFEYQYDQEGNACEGTRTDPDGKVTDQINYTNTYKYDHYGNLVEWVKRFDAGRVETTKYSYDEYGNLTQETYDWDGATVHKITYIYEMVYIPNA